MFARPAPRAGHRWEMDVLGEYVSPANVTAGGEQYIHALWSGVRYVTAGGGAAARGLWLSTLDAAMACPVLNTVAQKSLTPEASLLQSCFDYRIPSELSKQPLTDAMISGMGINLLANRFTISGFPQCACHRCSCICAGVVRMQLADAAAFATGYPFGVGELYQEKDETMQFRFAVEET